MISKETLLAEAAAAGFRPETLEKALLLISLLDSFNRHPFLKKRLALKGGTALNLFVFNVPRLSVDIDLNYVGAPDKDTMLKERDDLAQAARTVCEREGMSVRQSKSSHAGLSLILRHQSALGQGGDLKVDMNFMFRIPLWPGSNRTSYSVGSSPVIEFPILDIHELAGGKLAALFARQASRDLFDAHMLLTQGKLHREHLRLAFVLYGAMNVTDWRNIQVSDIRITEQEIRDKLVPVMRSGVLSKDSVALWTDRLINETKDLLSPLLQFTEEENEFLIQLRHHGEIRGDLLTMDAGMEQRINGHPGLQWRAIRAKEGKDD
jgi:hypothetical protein